MSTHAGKSRKELLELVRDMKSYHRSMRSMRTICEELELVAKLSPQVPVVRLRRLANACDNLGCAVWQAHLNLKKLAEEAGIE